MIIRFHEKKDTEWWRIWEHKTGVNVHIGDVSCNIAGGIPGLSKFSMEFNYQDIGVESSVSIEEVSFSATETKGVTNHSVKGYTKYYIKTRALVGAAVIVYGAVHCPPLLAPVCGSLLMAY